MSENKIQNSEVTSQAFCFLFSAFCFFSSAFCAFAQDQAIYDAKGKRDPFIPLINAEGRLLKLDNENSSRGLSLEGIIYDKNGQSLAIINSEIMQIGDKIIDYQVLKIEENAVILIKDGEIIRVALEKEE